MTPRRIPLMLGALWLGAALPALAAPPPPLDDGVRAELEASREALHAAARDYAALLETHGLPAPGPLGLGDPLRGQLGLRLGPPAAGPAGQPGLRIRDVAADSGAAQAGIRAGDLLLAIDGHPLPPPSDGGGKALGKSLLKLEVGQVVPVRIARDNQVLELSVTANAIPKRQGDGDRHRPRPLAWQLAPMRPALAPYFGTDQGVLILDVPEDSRFPLQPGDIITTVDDTAVDDPRALFRAVMRGEGDTLRLQVRRQGAMLTMEGPRPKRPVRSGPGPR